ncbi:glutathione transferase GstA [Hyphococcus luteus]|uniref:Glutathione transferase GstA n=1 Tax=Hyphococcus luteus TaxID=2058213 RepID=A0A2S7JZY3_9PROT|nr:glutathione transferase GstA [Marinicaulis flavus]PQA85814.1 glutathione transferase GstA [Marinicaulis flavus]
MKLYYKPGACSLASHIALNEAGVAVALEKTDTATKTTENGEDYSAINPNGYVPALRLDNGEILTEGPAILQFIADTNQSAGLAPENGTVERARVNALLNFAGSELHKAFAPLFADPAPEGAARDAIIEKIGTRLDHIESRLADGRAYLTGDAFTIADAYVFVVANWANFVNVDLSKWPNVVSFVKRVAARPAVTNALAAEGLLAQAA